jgi:hypothetical protein
MSLKLAFMPAKKTSSGSRKNPTKIFRAQLEPLDSNLGWMIARIPFDVQKTWGSSKVKVRGDINGFEFRTSLFANKLGWHFLLVNKKMQKGGRVSLGGTAEFKLTLDTAPRVASAPSELETILRQSKRLLSWFNNLPYGYRAYMRSWITEPKSPASRKRRAEQLAERMMETMEAEIELPPLIRFALAQNGKASRGWSLMTPIQRRSELMGIFYYRTPDARARRLQKALETAAAVADRKEGG